MHHLGPWHSERVTEHPPRRVVVGGGIGGLAAAYYLAQDPTYDVLLLEAGPEVGGKLRRDLIAGVPLDVGADSILNRRPEGVELAEELGFDPVFPEATQTGLWFDGAIRALPRTMMGVPVDPDDPALADVLGPVDLARVRLEPSMPLTEVGTDMSVGELVARRMGESVVDRLVEPMLGGMFAGHAWELSVRAAVPQLALAADRGSLLDHSGGIPRPFAAPVFAGVAGGLGLMPAALVDAGVFEVRTRAPVRELRSTPYGGFELILSRGEEPVTASDVVLATPAAVSARLLRGLAPRAATELAAIESASVVIVSLAFRARDFPEVPYAGFLVPPGEGRLIKTVGLSYNKWAWVREAGRTAGPRGNELLFLRVSAGRLGEGRALQLDDRELVMAVLTELSDALGLGSLPVDAHVQRWDQALPQYAVGHLDRVARIYRDLERASSVGRLTVCGSAYHGVGIPAVIGSGRRAASEVMDHRWTIPQDWVG